MINATQIRKGMILLIDDKLYRVEDMDHVTPGRYKSTIHAKMRDLSDMIMHQFRFGSSDRVEKVTLETKKVLYSYQDGEHYIFLDSETFDQLILDREFLGEQIHFIKENESYELEFFRGKPVNLLLPLTMEFAVTETEKALKGATAAASYKPARLENGLEVSVPPFIESGNIIKIDTRDSTYIERVSK